MAISKKLDRFSPTPPPQNIPFELQHWLIEEIERLTIVTNRSLELIDTINSIPAIYLYGTPDDIQLDTTDRKIVNYSFAASDGDVPIEPDPLLGTITVPETGLYSGTGFIYGIQGTATKDEEIHLLIDGVSTTGNFRYPIATFDVASRKTDSRVLSGSLTGNLTKGDVLSLWMNATDDLGLMDMQQSTFEIQRVR